MTTRSRTALQKELSDFYNEDIMKLITRWREDPRGSGEPAADLLAVARQQRNDNYVMTWRRISFRIAGDTGYRIAWTTLARWMSYERNGR